jgi:hypothetical protein
MPYFHMQKNIKYEKNAEYDNHPPGLTAAVSPGVGKKNMTNMQNMQNMQNNNFCKGMFCDFSRVLFTALPLVLCAGLRSRDAVDMFGLLTAYRFVLFSSSNALHAVPRRASLRLCCS